MIFIADNEEQHKPFIVSGQEGPLMPIISSTNGWDQPNKLESANGGSSQDSNKPPNDR